MSLNDAPAGDSGGQFPVSDLPEKLRVHALAKLIGRTSKEVLAALAEIGSPAKSPQAGIDRKTAEQVVTVLLPGAETAAPSAAAPAAEPAAPVAEPAAEPGAPEAAAAEPAEVSGEVSGPVAEPVEAPAPKRRRARARATFSAAAEPAEAPSDTEAAAPAAPGAPAAAVFSPPAPLFQAPAAEPAPRRRRRKADEVEQAEVPAEETVDTRAAEQADEAPVEKPRRRSRARAEQPAEVEPAADAETEPDTRADTDSEADQDADDDEAGNRRRRRRGRRGRGRGRGEGGDSADDTDESDDSGEQDDRSDDAAESEDAGTDGDDEDGDSDEGEGEGGSRRRRRRRRRKGPGDSGDDRTEDDPPNTVTRVRQARDTSRDREADDGVQSVRGSTRLEAKRQRRRDGRDAGRRRPPILSESEFLARREAVERTMVIRQTGQRNEIGVLEDGVLVEHFIAGGAGQSDSMVGNIYLGRVQNVLPSMEAAFVDIGRGRNAVLYAGEVDWDAAGLNGKARRIEQALSSGDSVLVQVTKDPVGHKGARLTTQISMAGRFLVYVPSGGAAGISRKLPDVERKRLKDMLKEIVPSEAGVIIRTASEGVSHEALERDVRRLQAQWEIVKEKAEKTGPKAPKAPTLLYEEPDLLVKVVRDQFNEDFASLVVSGGDAWDTVSEYVEHVAPELAERLSRHVGPKDVFAEYRVDEQLLKALDRKVWLPSGGTLVIDRTEAMTVVDVNTGKFTGSGGNLEETVTRNNLEAAEEVVRQLRLRDIGGIIVIDFIDMVLEANRDLVLRRLTECLARDRTRHQVAEVTSLGLVQMTRKRVGGGLLEHFSEPCEHCRGRGVIVSTDGVERADNPDHGREDSGGRRRRRRDERADDHGTGHNGNGNGSGGSGNGPRGNGHAPAGRSAVAAAVELVAAAGHGHGAAEQAAAPGGVVTASAAPVVVADPADPEALADMDQPDTGRPARRRGRRRAERPAGGPSQAAGAVVVTTAPPTDAENTAPADEAPAAETADAPAGVEPVAETAPAAPVETEPEETVPAETVPVEAVPLETVPAVEPVAPTPSSSDEGDKPARPRRRGRVTRSAGAPSSAAEPVVVTTPAPAGAAA
ncbi:translation initiation factor IF-2 N-terminal domain-containing protein, partial [Pseudonocardia ailaonensis]